MSKVDRLGEMITIPAGKFLMGTTGEGEHDKPEELPQHWVDLPAYEISKLQVTRAEYRRFMEEGGYQAQGLWSAEGWEWKESGVTIHSGMYGSNHEVEDTAGSGPRETPEHWEAEQEWVGHGFAHPVFTQTDAHPVVAVSYYEAEAYCAWAGGRLPTEAEWEKAAGWDEENQHPRVWPWGDTWDPNRCNNAEDSSSAAGGFEVNMSAPVGSYPEGVSPYGCMDMGGNGWEWNSGWAKSYDGSPEPFDHTGDYRFVRGGCWDDGPSSARCAGRSWYLTPRSGGTGLTDSDYITFRVAR